MCDKQQVGYENRIQSVLGPAYMLLPCRQGAVIRRVASSRTALVMTVPVSQQSLTLSAQRDNAHYRGRAQMDADAESQQQPFDSHTSSLYAHFTAEYNLVAGQCSALGRQKPRTCGHRHRRTTAAHVRASGRTSRCKSILNECTMSVHGCCDRHIPFAPCHIRSAVSRRLLLLQQRHSYALADGAGTADHLAQRHSRCYDINTLPRTAPAPDVTI